MRWDEFLKTTCTTQYHVRSTFWWLLRIYHTYLLDWSNMKKRQGQKIQLLLYSIVQYSTGYVLYESKEWITTQHKDENQKEKKNWEWQKQPQKERGSKMKKEKGKRKQEFNTAKTVDHVHAAKEPTHSHCWARSLHRKWMTCFRWRRSLAMVRFGSIHQDWRGRICSKKRKRKKEEQEEIHSHYHCHCHCH